MKAQHPFDLLREHQDILFPVLLKHAFCTLIGLLAILVWILYSVAWAVGFLWELFTDPLLKVNVLEAIIERLPRHLEYDTPLSPVYEYLQRSLDNELLSVLDSVEYAEEVPTPASEGEFMLEEQPERTPYDTNPEDIVELDEMTYPTDEEVDEWQRNAKVVIDTTRDWSGEYVEEDAEPKVTVLNNAPFSYTLNQYYNEYESAGSPTSDHARAASLFTEEDRDYLDARALDDSLDFHE